MLWLRVDQKSCLKAITVAGLDPIVIESKWQGDELVSDLAAIERAINLHEPQNILAIISCVSCFAPRAPDSVVGIGRLAQKHGGIPHLINGAYAAFSPAARNAVNNAHFDLLVLSLDKNFMVPVSGAVVFGPLTAQLLAGYPGRASASGCLDVLMTLLELGVRGLQKLALERLEAFTLMKTQLGSLTSGTGRLLSTPRNDISMALSVSPAGGPLLLGSRLFYRNVTGARLVLSGTSRVIDGVSFKNWCAHAEETEIEAYLNVAVGVGSGREEVLEFTNKLIKLL